MVLRMEGYSYRDIAELIHSSPVTVRGWFANDLLFRDTFNELAQEYVEQARAIIRNAAPDAAKRIVELQDNESGSVALNAARDVLDRAGLKPSDQIEANIRHSGVISHDVRFNLKQLSDDELAQLEAILERASESDGDQTGAGTPDV